MTAPATLGLCDTRQMLVVKDADLSGSTFEDVRLRAAHFLNVDMSDGVVEDAGLARLRVRNADLTGASFADCAMSGMTIDGVSVVDLVAAYRSVAGGG